MANPSSGYSTIVRLEDPSSFGATSELAAAVGAAGAAITALDVTRSPHETFVVDVSCNTTDAAPAHRVEAELNGLAGVTAVHLGGKLEVVPKVSLRKRDDLSRANTPGDARVYLAIADNPDDARNRTIKRNMVAVVTDGSAVLGLGGIGPKAALPVVDGKGALPSSLPSTPLSSLPGAATSGASSTMSSRSGVLPGTAGRERLQRHSRDAVTVAQTISEQISDDDLNASFNVPSIFDPHVAADVAAFVVAPATPRSK